MSKATTSNGYEIANPVAKATPESFRERMEEEYGLFGGSPAERLERLRDMSVEGIAILWEDINKMVQGSQDSLMNHETTMKIGGKDTLSLEDRYDVFLKLVEEIKSAPDDINPARVGDAMALGTVLLHPFHDGNGRTARMLGLLFRDEYDNEYEESFQVVSEPRDEARKRGGFMIYGYIPHLDHQGLDQADPADVSQYLHEILHEEKPGAYTSCYGQAPLRA